MFQAGDDGVCHDVAEAGSDMYESTSMSRATVRKLTNVQDWTGSKLWPR